MRVDAAAIGLLFALGWACGGGGGSGGGAGGSAGTDGGVNADVAGIWTGSTVASGVTVGVLLEIVRDPESQALSGHAWLQISGHMCDGDMVAVSPRPFGFGAALPEIDSGNVTCEALQLSGHVDATGQMQLTLTEPDGAISASLERLTRLTPSTLVAANVRQASASPDVELLGATYVDPGLVAVAVAGPGTIAFADSSWDVPADGLLMVDASTNQVAARFEVTLSGGSLYQVAPAIAGGSGQALVSAGATNGTSGDYTIASSTASQTVTSTSGSERITAVVQSDGSIAWAKLFETDRFLWRPAQNDWIALDETASVPELHWLDSTGNLASSAPLPDLANNVMTVGADGSVAVFAQNDDVLALTRFDPAGAQLSQGEIAIGVSSLAGAVTLPDGAIVASGHFYGPIIGAMMLFRVEPDDSVSWKIPIDGGYDISLQRAGTDILVLGQRRNPFTRFASHVLDFDGARYLARVDGISGQFRGACILDGEEVPLTATIRESGELFVSTRDSIGTYQACQSGR